MNADELSALQTNEDKEAYTMRVAQQMIHAGDYAALLEMIKGLRTAWGSLSTARLTKIIKQIFSTMSVNHRTYAGVLQWLEGLIAWADGNNILRLDLECKEVRVLLSIGQYRECLSKIEGLVRELKRYDDQANLIALHISESRAYYELRDSARARSALTSARALAVSAACTPGQLAHVDLLNGMYLADEGAYGTAAAYLMEALDGFMHDFEETNARVALRYLLLVRIMGTYYGNSMAGSDAKNVEAKLAETKHADRVKDDEVIVVLQQINEACRQRDLGAYNSVLCESRAVLEADGFIYRHLRLLYDVLLEKNILKVVEPYSHVRINYVAERIGLPEGVVEERLRKMILDKGLDGSIDHVTQCLVLYSGETGAPDTMLSDICILKDYFAKAG